MKKGPAPQPLWDRLSRYIDVGDCWIWTGARRHGYGVFEQHGKTRPTHRVVYESLVGPIPDGLQLDHLCRTPSCVNPDHLEPVTGRVNTLRSPLGAGARARRTHCPQGHEYTPENTRVSGRNQRNCRACARAYQDRRRQAAPIRAATP